MDISDSPFVNDPSRVVGSASYRFTEDVFVAASRASGMAQHRWYGSPAAKIAGFGLLHLMLAAGIVTAAFGLRDAIRSDASGGGGDRMFLGCSLAIFSAWLLWQTFYAFRRRLLAMHGRFTIAMDEVLFIFTPDRLIIHGPRIDSTEDWSFYGGVLELRDGFVLRTKSFPGGVWIPFDALQPPFDRATAAAFFREKFPNYRVVDRAAALDGPRDSGT